MDIRYLLELLKSAFEELSNYKYAGTAIFIAVTFVLCFLGSVWPQTYTTTALIQADRKNIIEPLLPGRVAMTEVPPVSIVIETLYSPRILIRAAEEIGLINDESSDREMDIAKNRIGAALEHKIVDDNLLRLTVTSDSPEKSYDTLTKVLEVFNEDASKQKQDESKNAFDFISTQVNKYKIQLEEAETKLSDYKINNMVGTELGVQNRISELRIELESLEISVEENEAKAASIRSQLVNESVFQEARSKLATLNTQKVEIQNNLQTLQLSFQDDYPDVVSAKSQLAAVQYEIDYLRDLYPELPSDISSDEITLFDELRGTLSDIEIENKSLKRRRTAIEALLKKENERAEKITQDQAKLAELTRDYDKTKQIYEELLQRRENASLSMTIDKEGQGMSYRVREAPTYPTQPTGLQAMHFVIAAPVLGALAPLGLCFIFVFLDPRIRTSYSLRNHLPEGIDILGSVPAYEEASAPGFSAFSNKLILIIILLSLGCYGYLASLLLAGQ
ncbi:hypothetical protein [Marinibactrum halimedae]|uniref:Polysaccharide chain length determinant N-terminal domain-containing protein n=1 Tax=Marinibactrum halimedae TaxID=1444977 RepID=A0AA37T5Z1_9GAMM|nr:hypothetical protein [Marinibactrum halimedae]MCD9459767.1 hypothetical protein [Marinibactrum halimedae]GLS24476.1 hypothetical protein GCM10007877_01880 [Marinibactrum halimedae]